MEKHTAHDTAHPNEGTFQNIKARLSKQVISDRTERYICLFIGILGAIMLNVAAIWVFNFCK